MTFEGLFFWFAITLTVTYGMTASSLLMAVRIFLGVRFGIAATLVYCPVCFGFWVALATAPLFPHAGAWAYALSPACFVTIVLLLKLYRDDFLVAPTYAAELDVIAHARGEQPHE